MKKIDQTDYSPIVFERLEKIRLYDKLCAEGCSQETAREAIKVSRATLYRWKRAYKKFELDGLGLKSKRPLRLRKPEWTHQVERLVLETRRQYKIYGKHKLATIIKERHGIGLSVSTIGRILKKLIADGKLLSASSHFKGKLPKM